MIKVFLNRSAELYTMRPMYDCTYTGLRCESLAKQPWQKVGQLFKSTVPSHSCTRAPIERFIVGLWIQTHNADMRRIVKHVIGKVDMCEPAIAVSRGAK